MSYANGKKYTGDWVKDKQMGHGVFTWPNGDRYEGQYKDGRMHGTGTYNYADGKKYIGDWKEDARAGRGIYTWPNGDRYEIKCSEISCDYIHMR